MLFIWKYTTFQQGSSAGSGAVDAGDHLVKQAGNFDAYILGRAKIGTAMRRSGLFASANIPFMLQNVGGHITRTMTTHMQAAFKTASFHFQCDAESWKSDVVKERQEPTNGFVSVPEKPGLGLTLDRDDLQQLKDLKLPPQPKWIIKKRFERGQV